MCRTMGKLLLAVKTKMKTSALDLEIVKSMKTYQQSKRTEEDKDLRSAIKLSLLSKGSSLIYSTKNGLCFQEMNIKAEDNDEYSLLFCFFFQ